MIYVDVTGACRLPLQTGIPRTSRELYNLIKESRGLPNVMPVVWQPFTASYTRLSPKSEGLLHTPFEGKTSRRKPPSDSTLPILAAALEDLLRHTPQRVDAKLFLTSGSTLLITSIFPDNRLEYLLRLQGKPGRRLAIFHDAIPLLDPAVKGWIRDRHIKALEVFSGMDAVICVSQASEEVLKKLWGDHGMVSTATHVLPWPVPLGGPRPSWTEPPNGVPSVLCVGRLKKLKNQAVLMDACEILWRDGHQFSLDFIGCEDVPSESRSILNRIELLKQKGRGIRWCGHVTDEDLYQSYRNAMFTVFPSLEEGMGLPILESLWHGRPVICGLDEPMVSVGKGPGCLHADMRSAEELAGVMRSLFDDRTMTLGLAREAHRRPLRTWDDYFSVFEGILLEDQVR
jgi:glycosyltransferase involved in cell wall biosynthesis